MKHYVAFWVFWIVVRALMNGNKHYKACLEAGHNVDHFRQTGEYIAFHGGMRERIPCTIASALGVMVSPVFLLLESVFCIPAMFILYLINR